MRLADGSLEAVFPSAPPAPPELAPLILA
jgi:hypothetical protein